MNFFFALTQTSGGVCGYGHLELGVGVLHVDRALAARRGSLLTVTGLLALDQSQTSMWSRDPVSANHSSPGQCSSGTGGTCRRPAACTASPRGCCRHPPPRLETEASATNIFMQQVNIFSVTTFRWISSTLLFWFPPRSLEIELTGKIQLVRPSVKCGTWAGL